MNITGICAVYAIKKGSKVKFIDGVLRTIHYIGADIEGPGYEGPSDIAVWGVREVDLNIAIFAAVDDLAEHSTTSGTMWPISNIWQESDIEVEMVRDCVREALATKVQSPTQKP